MENLYYNLSEEEFSKGRKILLWIFSCLFFLAGLFVLSQSLIFGHKSVHPVLALAPFGISLVVSVIAAFASIKRKSAEAAKHNNGPRLNEKITALMRTQNLSRKNSPLGRKTAHLDALS